MKKILAFLVTFFIILTLNASETKIVLDMADNKLQIPKDIKKIAALWHANNQIIYVLGGGDKIVATTKKIQNNKWFAQIYPRIKTIPATFNDNDINIEELLSLSPDIVAVSNKKFKEELDKHGFNTAFLLFTNYEGMKKSINATAAIIGNKAEQKAQTYIQYLDKNIEKVKAKTQNIKLQDRPKVLHIVNGSNLLKIDGKKTIIDEWIQLAGGRNAIEIEGPMKDITIEEIINANPDIIIIGGENNQKSVDKIYANAAFSGIKAVQNKQVFGNPSGVFYWDRYGAEEALEVLWAAKTIQPNLFTDIDIIAETKKFYKLFMNYNLNDNEVEYILKGLSPKGE